MSQQAENNIDITPKKPFWEKGEKAKFAIFTFFMSFIWLKYVDQIAYFYKREKPISTDHEDIIYQIIFGLNLPDFLAPIVLLFFFIMIEWGVLPIFFLFWSFPKIFNNNHVFKKYFLCLSIMFIVVAVIKSGICYNDKLIKHCPPTKVFGMFSLSFFTLLIPLFIIHTIDIFRIILIFLIKFHLEHKFLFQKRKNP